MTGIRVLFRERGPPRERDQLSQRPASPPPPSAQPKFSATTTTPLYRSASTDSNVVARQPNYKGPTWRQRLFSNSRRNDVLRKVSTTASQAPTVVPFDAVKNSSQVVTVPVHASRQEPLEVEIRSASPLPRPPTLPGQTRSTLKSSASTITSEVLEHRLSKVLHSEELRIAKSDQPLRAVKAPGLTSLQRVGARRLSEARIHRIGASRLDEMFDHSASRTQVNSDHAQAELTPTRSPSPAPLARTRVDPELLAQELCRLELERQARRMDKHRRSRSHQGHSDNYNLDRIFRGREMSPVRPLFARGSSWESVAPSALAPASPSSSLSGPGERATTLESLYAPVHPVPSLETVHEEDRRRLNLATPYHTPSHTPTLDFGSLGPPTCTPGDTVAALVYDEPQTTVGSRSPLSVRSATSDDGDDLGYDSDVTVRRIESWRGSVLKASNKKIYAPSAAGTEPSTFEISRGVAHLATDDLDNEGSVLTSVSRAKPRHAPSTTRIFVPADPGDSIASVMVSRTTAHPPSALPFGTTHKTYCKGTSFIFDHYFGADAV